MLHVLAKAAVGAAAALALVAPAQAASAAPIRPAAVGHQSEVFCGYVVTADWLRYHTAPGVNTPAPGQYRYGTFLTGYRDRLASADGYTWRQLANGYWVAAQYLRRSGGCFE
jgi:hypothetical protein